jgi:hypothetical protein
MAHGGRITAHSQLATVQQQQKQTSQPTFSIQPEPASQPKQSADDNSHTPPNQSFELNLLIVRHAPPVVLACCLSLMSKGVAKTGNKGEESLLDSFRSVSSRATRGGMRHATGDTESSTAGCGR